MQGSDQESYLSQAREKLFEIVDGMLEPFGKKLPRTYGLLKYKLKTPFDISRPNQHDTQGDFQLEYDTITTCLQGLKTALDAASPGKFEDKEYLWRNMKFYVDAQFRRNEKVHEPSGALELILNNITDAGGFATSLLVMQILQIALEVRKKELDKQEKLFWSLKHRAPNYYARAIALRLAKLYANETGCRPTYGTTPDTGDPSTSYTRALRDVFEVLEIKGGVGTYAKWAVNKLTDDDLNNEGIYREVNQHLETFVYPGFLDEIKLLADRA